LKCFPLEGDGERRSFLLIVDPGDLRSEMMEKIAKEIYRDSATGLPGLRLFIDRLDKEYFAAGKAENQGALLFIAFDDVYRFGQLGGGDKEDRVLRQLTERLEKFCRKRDLLAYVGNDSFVFFRPGVRQVGEAEALAKNLLHRHSEALAVDGELFYLNLAVGIALAPFDGSTGTELVRLAEKAMREARQDGWNHYSFYHRLRSDTRIDMLEQLRKALPEAIEKEEIRFVYQPQFSLEERRFVGAEMLVRWRHESLGELSPELFLPLAEQSGMIRFITMKALTRASTVFQKLEELGRSDFSLSVNLSPSAIFQRDFLENIQFFLTHYELEGKPLNLEITENILAHNMAVMKKTLDALKSMGLGIEIDDYGTGYTSLSTLIELPVDKVKIDRQYVREIDRDPKVRTIYRAMYQTAEALGLGVIAEGVERPEEEEVIASVGPVTVQGWHCSRPLEEEALFQLLAGKKAD
jgi:diguanylate cyclase (GGDEF)-like protein